MKIKCKVVVEEFGGFIEEMYNECHTIRSDTLRNKRI